MKINPNIAAGSSGIQSAESKKTEKAKAAGSENKSLPASAPIKNDSVNAEISSRAHDMAKAKQVASDTPDVREAKIAELKDRIKNNNYKVSADAIADRLVDEHMSMGGA